MQICEEAPAQLEVEVPLGGKAERPSNLLVPRLLALFGSSVEDAKCLAVSILNLLAGGMPKALADNMETCARFLALMRSLPGLAMVIFWVCFAAALVRPGSLFLLVDAGRHATHFLLCVLDWVRCRAGNHNRPSSVFSSPAARR